MFSVIFVITLLVFAFINFYLNHYNMFTEDIGVVTSISTSITKDDTVELKIKYQFPTGGYSVRVVPEDEGEYIGDGMKDYDGSLGRYRMIVEFGDIEPSSAIAMRFAPSDTVVIKNLPIKIRAKIAHPSDHGFVLYLGFDEPISLEAVENGELNSLGGTISIPVKIEEK